VKNRPEALACNDRAKWVLDKLKEGTGPASTRQAKKRGKKA